MNGTLNAMDKITFVLPSRNNLEFLKLAYRSIRDLKITHEILILDDASLDGTQEWIKELNKLITNIGIPKNIFR